MEEILRIYSKLVHRNGNASQSQQSLLYNYFIVPFMAGIAGFANFLFLVILFELLAYVTGIDNSVKIGFTEVLIAALGFVLQFIYQLFNKTRTLLRK